MSPAPVHFDAPRDGGVRLVTGLTYAILAAVAGGLAWAGWSLRAEHGNPVLAAVPLLFLVVPGLLLYAASLGAPRGYVVDDRAVRIERRAGPVTIPLADVADARRIEPPARFARIGGSGGFLGYFGEFRNPNLGPVRMYASRGDGQVLLVTGGGRVVVTPADPDAFVAEVRGRSPGRDGK